jgi:hypothetical protein
VWEWFYELDETRETGMSLESISHTEISNWAEGMKIDLSPFERRCLRAIDRVYVDHIRSKGKK